MWGQAIQKYSGLPVKEKSPKNTELGKRMPLCTNKSLNAFSGWFLSLIGW